MKGRREEGGKDGRQSVCLSECVCVCWGSKPSVLIFLLRHSEPSLSFSPSLGENNNAGESPFSPEGGADGSKEVVGHWDKGALCW